MGSVYISIVLCCRVVQHLYGKKVSNMINGVAENIRYNGVKQCISAFFALVIILLGGNGVKVDLPTVLLSTLSGSMIAVSSACTVVALKTGMVSLVSLFGTAGLIVPCFAGVFMFDTPIMPMQWVGFGMFMIAAYLLIMGSKATVKGFSVKTFLLLLIVMLSNGLTMLAQQTFSKCVPNGDVSMFSFLSFGIVGVAMLAFLPFVKRRSKEKNAPMPKSLLLYGLILAIVLLIINQLATLASAFVPPVILFTFINGGSTVIASIIAAIVYKEKLTVRSSLGVILGVLSFVIIKAFQM